MFDADSRCHVLAHESFEDESIAKLMNEHFVNIKVDREERPDVDRMYMTYLQVGRLSHTCANVLKAGDVRRWWMADVDLYVRIRGCADGSHDARFGTFLCR
jgi:hypothetical protein